MGSKRTGQASLFRHAPASFDSNPRGAAALAAVDDEAWTDPPTGFGPEPRRISDVPLSPTHLREDPR